MKKYIVIFTVISVLICTIFTSCSSSTEDYSVYEIDDGLSENSSFVTHDYRFCSSTEDKQEIVLADRNVSITVGNLTLEGEYQSTKTFELFGTSVKCYLGTDQYGRNVEFNIDDATGRLSRMSFRPHTETDHLYTQAECQEIAEDFLRAVVGEDTTYILYDTVTREIKEHGGVSYEFMFAKSFGDLLSDEDIIVNVSSYGVIEYYLAYFLYGNDDPTELSYDEQAADEAIAEQIAIIYGELESTDYTFTSYTVKEKRISKFHDGNHYIRYDIRVRLDHKSEEYVEKHESLVLAVRIP